MSKSPAFQFYPNDWLSSTNISLMTSSQEGAYIRLLCYAWNDPDCSIPDDDNLLAALSRLGEGWFKGGSTVVRKCFQPHPTIPGKLINIRLIKEREKQTAWREKSIEGGKKSAKLRKLKDKKRVKGGSRVVRPPYQPNGNSSSSFSSSSLENKELKNIYGEFENVNLTEDEYSKLIERFGEQGVESRIENLSCGIKSKGYKYKSHYATILSWERKNNPQPEKKKLQVCL